MPLAYDSLRVPPPQLIKEVRGVPHSGPSEMGSCDSAAIFSSFPDSEPLIERLSRLCFLDKELFSG